MNNNKKIKGIFNKILSTTLISASCVTNFNSVIFASAPREDCEEVCGETNTTSEKGACKLIYVFDIDNELSFVAIGDFNERIFNDVVQQCEEVAKNKNMIFTGLLGKNTQKTYTNFESVKVLEGTEYKFTAQFQKRQEIQPIQAEIKMNLVVVFKKIDGSDLYSQEFENVKVKKLECECKIVDEIEIKLDQTHIEKVEQEHLKLLMWQESKDFKLFDKDKINLKNLRFTAEKESIELEPVLVPEGVIGKFIRNGEKYTIKLRYSAPFGKDLYRWNIKRLDATKKLTKDIEITVLDPVSEDKRYTVKSGKIIFKGNGKESKLMSDGVCCRPGTAFRNNGDNSWFIFTPVFEDKEVVELEKESKEIEIEQSKCCSGESKEIEIEQSKCCSEESKEIEIEQSKCCSEESKEIEIEQSKCCSEEIEKIESCSFEDPDCCEEINSLSESTIKEKIENKNVRIRHYIGENIINKYDNEAASKKLCETSVKRVFGEDAEIIGWSLYPVKDSRHCVQVSLSGKLNSSLLSCSSLNISISNRGLLVVNLYPVIKK